MSNSKKPSTLSLVKELDQKANLLKSGDYIHELDGNVPPPNMPAPTNPEAVIVAVPTAGLEPGWAKALLIAQNPPAMASLLFSENDAARSQGVHLQRLYGMAWHWLYREKLKPKRERRHKMPFEWRSFEKCARDAVITFGTMLDKLRLVCIGIYARVDHDRIPVYKNAAEWFLAVVLEMRAWDVASAQQNSMRGKAALVEHYESQLKRLRVKSDYSSPYDPDIMPHTHRLMHYAWHLAARDGSFESDCWRPYLKSFTAFKRDIEHNSAWVMVFEEGGKNYYHPGKGRGKVAL